MAQAMLVGAVGEGGPDNRGFWWSLPKRARGTFRKEDLARLERDCDLELELAIAEIRRGVGDPLFWTSFLHAHWKARMFLRNWGHEKLPAGYLDVEE